jgi:hypothetical protein
VRSADFQHKNGEKSLIWIPFLPGTGTLILRELRAFIKISFYSLNFLHAFIRQDDGMFSENVKVYFFGAFRHFQIK